MSTRTTPCRRPALPQSWGDAELATISYGHGIALSPLHLVTSFAAVVNGGIRIKPRFLVAEPEEQDQILSADTSALMRRALRRVVTDGTGKRAEAAGYHVIGKTATADKPGVGGYGANDQVIASFVGAFPGHAPEWVLLVSLDEPQGIPATSGLTTAGMNAAPLFRRIVERLAPVLHVMPVADDVAIDSFMAMRNEMGAAGQALPAAGAITEAYSQPQPQSLSPYHDPITPLLRGSAGGGDGGAVEQRQSGVDKLRRVQPREVVLQRRLVLIDIHVGEAQRPQLQPAVERADVAEMLKDMRAEAAHRTFFDDDQRFMRSGEFFDQSRVDRLRPTGVGDGRRNAMAGQRFRRGQRFMQPRTQGQEGDSSAVADDPAFADRQWSRIVRDGDAAANAR